MKNSFKNSTLPRVEQTMGDGSKGVAGGGRGGGVSTGSGRGRGGRFTNGRRNVRVPAWAVGGDQGAEDGPDGT